MSRIPFVAAVVGALLIGGATTGGTHASWVQGAQLPTSSVKAGNMGATTPLSAAFPANFAPGGSIQYAIFTVTDASAGKHLSQRVTASLGLPVPTGFTVRLQAVPAGTTTCSGASVTSVDSADLGPAVTAKSATFCVKATSAANAPSGTIQINLRGQQQPQGWSWSGKSVAIPTALNLQCGSQSVEDQMPLTWNALGFTSFTIERSSTSAFGAPNTTTVATTSSTVTLPAGNTGDIWYYRIRYGASSYSNPIAITRINSGNKKNLSCGAA